ncbi:hypothetical protein GCM10028822_30550 [Hymenobacter terrigena]
MDQYIARLRQSKAEGGSETAFMSSGNYFLYGQDYLDSKNYSAAADYFEDAIRVAPTNAFALYQEAICLIRQNEPGKAQKAQEYFQKAFALNSGLQQQHAKDVPGSTPTPNPVTTAPAQPAPVAVAPAATGLDGYIQQLKHSRAVGGQETVMNSAGHDALAGIEYYELNKFGGAETELRLALTREANNPYVNYLLAVSLAAQNKSTEANTYLAKAVAGDASLSIRFQKDAPSAKAAWEKSQPKETPPAAPIPTKAGGTLLFGNYTCTVTVYNGPNASPAFRNDYRGYFLLRPNGTYRWLDNGGEGRYSYNPATGLITWLSGRFEANQGQTIYKVLPSGNGQATVNLVDNLRWECGCKKK